MNLYTQKFMFNELKHFDSRTKRHIWLFEYRFSEVQCLATEPQFKEKFQWTEALALQIQAHFSS